MTHPTAKVSEQVNRKLSQKMILQLLTPYTGPIPSNSLPLELIMFSAIWQINYKHTYASVT